MDQVDNLIYSAYNRINSEIADINDSFRNEILRSLLNFKSQEYPDTDTMFKDFFSKKIEVKDIQRTQSQYIKLLNDLKLVTKDEEITYNEFFDIFANDLSKIQLKGNLTLFVNLMIKYNEIAKIRKIVELAGNLEKSKSVKRKPLEIFLNTMNEFIQTSEDDKTICIDQYGKTYFQTKCNDKHIDIRYLSSGEKQLLTFFAYLIFRVKNTQSGIFVVDEPELSLHLTWQKIFVERTIQINKNVQLIFATHSPEIIGKYRDKTFKLIKQYE